MKKIINLKSIIQIAVAIAAVIALLLTCFTIYYRISLNKANTAPIHNEAEWLIKVDGVEVFKNLYYEFLFDSEPKQLVDSSHFRIVNSITMPLNIYIFNTKKDPVGFYTSFILQDEKILMNNLKHRNTWTILDDSNKIFKHEKYNLYVTYNNERVFFAWNINKKVGMEVLHDLVQKRNVTPYNKTKFTEVFNQSNVLTASNLREHLYMSIAHDSLIITGNYTWTKHTKHEIHFRDSLAEENQIAQYCIHKKGKINFPNILSLDNNTMQFFDNFNNNSHINLAGQILDSNITYEEVKVLVNADTTDDLLSTTTITQKKIPMMRLIYQEGENISKFKSAGKNKIEDKYFQYFPLYTVPYNAISNVATDKLDKKQTNTNCGFQLAIDLDKLSEVEQLNNFKNFLQPFSKLNIKGKITKPNELTVNGHITLDIHNQNALQTLYNQFRF